MSGDVVLVKAKEQVTQILHSMSHGTGRAMSRSDCKPLADAYDFACLRKSVLIPTGVEDASLRTDGPFWPRTRRTPFLQWCLTAPDGINRLCALYSGLSKQNSPPSSYIHYIGESPNALPAVRCVPYVQTIDVAQSRYDSAPREQ
jgi:hypothetical protein